jgi:lactate dehydrogenase-like 2-hydroxyacid dehydrogenase
MADPIGVPVWRFQHHGVHERNDVWRTGESLGEFSTPHLAFPTSPEAVAEMRGEIVAELRAWISGEPEEVVADAVLRALGLTDASSS